MIHYCLPMTRAFKYKRISDDPEGLELGVTRQDEDIDKLAEQLGATVVGSFTDNDVSASTLSKKPREDYDLMMTAAQSGECDMILAYSNSRLTRRPAEWEDLLQLYAARRVEIHTVVSGSANFATADGRAVARTIAAWDAAEAERIGERVRRAILQKAEQGKPHGGSRAYGWDADRVTPVPDEWLIIRELANRVIAGEAIHQLARDLNERSVPTVSGKPWSRAAIRYMLKSPRMIGIRVHKGIEYPAAWPAVLDELTWRHARSVLDARVTGANARVSLLAGIAVCGECGGKLQMKAGGTGPVYRCPPCHLSRLRNLVDYYVSRTMVHLLERGFRAEEPASPIQLQAINDLRAKIADTQARFVNSDAVTPEQFEAMMRNLNRRLAAEESKVLPPRPGRIAAKVMGEDAGGKWDALSLDAQRKIVAELAEVKLHRAPKGRRGFDPDTVEIIPRVEVT
jgi:site-specific DNA recombinase